MTVSNTSNSTTALGNGVTTIFNYSFPMVNASYARVVYTDEDGVETTLNASQYTLVIGAAGGTVTYPTAGSPISTGTTLTISRIVPYVQTTDISAQGPTFAAIEDGLDNLEYQIQQVANGVSASYSDAFFQIYNATDTTKIIKFFAGDVATGTTNTYALPPGSADLVTDTATQTLTNKTLTSPVITGYTQYSVLLGGGTASDIQALAPGAAGTALVSNGAGFNPSWQSLPGVGTVISVGVSAGLTATFNPITASGTISLASITTGWVLANVSGTTASPTGASVSAVLDTIVGTTGSILYRGASAWEGATPSTSGYIWTSNGAGAAPTYQPPIMPGYIYGLTVSINGSDAANDLDIASGYAAATTSGVVMNLSTSLTKQTDAPWAAGTNQGSLDTGAVTASGTYHVFLIQRPDTMETDILTSLSATAPTLPANYTRHRRIWSIVRTGSATLTFTQNGNECLVNPQNAFNANNPGTASVTRTLANVPTGIVVDVNLSLTIDDNSPAGANHVLVTSLAQTDVTPSQTILDLNLTGAGTQESDSTNKTVRTNTSAQIRTRQTVSDADMTLIGTLLGWYDYRGQYGSP